MYEPFRQPEIGTFTSRKRYDNPAPVIHAKGVYYHSDGTGRDGYIV